MNILFIGYQNKLNDTVVDLLAGQEHFEVENCPPNLLESRLQEVQQPLYDIMMVDLTSYQIKPTEVVSQLKKLEVYHFLIAIHIYTSAHLIKPILQAGADGYLPSATTETDLLTAINKISNGYSYPEL